MNEGARKNDQGKPDLSLIPQIAAVRLAEALGVGARKYTRYNYCSGLEASRQVGALLRHVFAWMNGEEFDPQDGQHHLGSAMANCAMILHEMELGTLKDDRYRKPVAVATGAAAQAPAVEVVKPVNRSLMKPVAPQAGKKYRTRGPHLDHETGLVQFYEVTVVSVGTTLGWPGDGPVEVRDRGTWFVQKDGSYLPNSEYDLVEEIIEGGKPFPFLEVGKTYLRRDGKTRTIVEYIPTAEYPYVDEEHSHYLPSGRWLSDLEKWPADLVAETGPSAPKVGGAGLTKEGPASTPEGGGA